MLDREKMPGADCMKCTLQSVIRFMSASHSRLEYAFMKSHIRHTAKTVTAGVLYLAAQAVFAHPCNGVDRSLNEAQKASFAPAVQAHMKAQLSAQVAAGVVVRRNDVLGMFRAGGWYIVHANNHATDDPYLFYSTNPTRASGYVGVWAGGAAADEGPEIQAWVTKEMPGIPRKLAECFSWYVTYGK